MPLGARPEMADVCGGGSLYPVPRRGPILCPTSHSSGWYWSMTKGCCATECMFFCVVIILNPQSNPIQIPCVMPYMHEVLVRFDYRHVCPTSLFRGVLIINKRGSVKSPSGVVSCPVPACLGCMGRHETLQGSIVH